MKRGFIDDVGAGVIRIAEEVGGILVLTGQVRREVAAGVAPNAHDFMIALERAEKTRAAEERLAPVPDGPAGDTDERRLRLVARAADGSKSAS